MHTHIVPQVYINNDDDDDDHKIKSGYYTFDRHFNNSKSK